MGGEQVRPELNKFLRFLTTIYFIIISTLYLVFYGGFVLIRGWLLKKFKGEDESRNYVLREIEKFGKRAFSWLFSKVEIEGLENVPDEPVLIVSNHQSIMDIPLILGFVKRGGFIAKKELEKVPGVSWFIKYLGGVFIDRGNMRQTAREIKKVLKRMEEGTSYIVFPEGTRTEDGSVRDFKKGSLYLAMKTGVKVLPVAIWGTMYLVPKRTLLFSPGKVYAKILPPVDPKDFKSEEELTEHVRRSIVEAVEKLKEKAMRDWRVV